MSLDAKQTAIRATALFVDLAVYETTNISLSLMVLSTLGLNERVVLHVFVCVRVQQVVERALLVDGLFSWWCWQWQWQYLLKRRSSACDGMQQRGNFSQGRRF
ncbi:hypothetical protein CEXT_545421 [Caerostris extrusa]|uniref:Uncharacterized protein n=1 Tax=Caerostris extrusa TaxID=172846 RepID=A0AAV4QP11_CAEEX|nr:hypothetical protein CEXT_545421 [Caerostris extrusa]